MQDHHCVSPAGLKKSISWYAVTPLAHANSTKPSCSVLRGLYLMSYPTACDRSSIQIYRSDDRSPGTDCITIWSSCLQSGSRRYATFVNSVTLKRCPLQVLYHGSSGWLCFQKSLFVTPKFQNLPLFSARVAPSMWERIPATLSEMVTGASFMP